MIAAFFVGLTLMIALIVIQGADHVLAALAVAGPALPLIAAFHVIPIVAEAVGWWILFDTKARPRLAAIVRARWIGESVDNLLPAAHLGGDFVKAALVMRAGVPGPAASATVVADLTLSVLAQLLFTVVGLALLFLQLGQAAGALAILGGIAITGALVFLFYHVQHRGLFGAAARLLDRIGSKLKLNLTGGAEAMDRELVAIYGDRRRVAASMVWLFLGWALGAGEVWVALWFLDHPVTLMQALLIESLVQAARSMVFVLPGAVGVQEGGFLVLGGVVGLPADVSLALALTRRVRELGLGVPGLLYWQIHETRRFARRRRQMRES